MDSAKLSGAAPTTHTMWGPRVSAAGVTYSLWAPEHAEVSVEIRTPPATEPRVCRLQPAGNGFFAGTDAKGRAGDVYQFRLGEDLLPDPASRAQSGSVHGASLVVDGSRFPWRDAAWIRPEFRDLVIYELHVGTFTPEGTFRAAIEKLPHLQALGVRAIELMPIADFPGERSWGYDGVLMYAPARAYGSPDDLRALVDAAHGHGIAVILDVVYNHFGPDGNYLGRFTDRFFNHKHHTPWGAGFNFDGEMAGPVRDFFLGNPIYWMEEFHVDGFRFDATHEIHDDSPRHILAAMVSAIHARGGYAIAEDARNDARLLRDELADGFGFDAVWADDFHHVMRVGQTQDREGYFGDFAGTLPELMETLQRGWLFCGQRSRVTGKIRGTACEDLPPSKFLHCISNHDQVGNRAFGERLSHITSPEAYRALSLLLCATPFTPMLFMGQEWAASTPFQYFTDHNAELGRLITLGRRREFAGFSAFSDETRLEKIPDPQAEETFRASKLKWDEVGTGPHEGIRALYAEALRLRNRVPALRPRDRESWKAGQLPWGAGVIRLDAERACYLLILDLEGGHEGSLVGDPLCELPYGFQWSPVLSSNEARFGGTGEASFDAAAQACRFAVAETLLLKAEEPGGKR